MDKQLLVAESLLDWIDIKMLELSTEQFSEQERKDKYKKIRSFLEGYRERDEKLALILLQEEWQEVRGWLFRKQKKVH